jgi:HlyD family secretion protein
LTNVLKKWLPKIAVALVLVGAAVFLVIKQPWAKGDTPVTFTTVAAGRGSIQAQVTANGTLSARSTVMVGAQVSGKIVELDTDFNQVVKKGQIIAKLDDQLLKAQIEQAQAAYDLAVANQQKAAVAVTDADRQYNRQKGLQDQQLVAVGTVETFETTLAAAKASLTASRAQVSQAAANLKQARTNLEYATIMSPVNGVVLSRAVELGQTVASSLQAPTLFTIAEDLSRMQIDTAVAESDVGRLNDGVKVTFTVDAFPGKTFEAVVRQVRNSPTNQSGVVTYDAVIDVDNTNKLLRPGMTANVTFVLDQVADTVKIPNSALRFKPTRDQITAMNAQFGGGRGSGGGGWGGGSDGSGSGGRRRGGNNNGGSGMGMGMTPRADAATSASGQVSPKDKDNPDRKVVWKLVDGKPKRTMIKIGLTDGSQTQLVEGDLKEGDQLITEIQGVAAPTRKVGVF